jgi:hypothetical protein
MNGAPRTATRSISSEDPARKMDAGPILDSPGATLYKTALSRTLRILALRHPAGPEEHVECSRPR